MSFTIEIDEHSLEQTTRALRTINPGRSSADHIRWVVNTNMRDGTTSLGTAGWEATGYFPDHKPGVMVVRLSVSAYSVNHWLEACIGVNSVSGELNDPRSVIRAA